MTHDGGGAQEVLAAGRGARCHFDERNGHALAGVRAQYGLRRKQVVRAYPLAVESEVGRGFRRLMKSKREGISHDVDLCTPSRFNNEVLPTLFAPMTSTTCLSRAGFIQSDLQFLQ